MADDDIKIRQHLFKLLKLTFWSWNSSLSTVSLYAGNVTAKADDVVSSNICWKLYDITIMLHLGLLGPSGFTQIKNWNMIKATFSTFFRVDVLYLYSIRFTSAWHTIIYDTL